MNRIGYIGKATLIMAITVSSAQAGNKLSWFGEATFSGAYPSDSSETSLEKQGAGDLAKTNADWQLKSGHKLLERQLALDSVFNSGDLESLESQTVRSELGVALGDEAISVPLYYRRANYQNGEAQKLDSFGLKWRHNFDGVGSLVLQARYGTGAYLRPDESTQDAANSVASVSWTSGFEQSGVTGSVYVGDERYKELEAAETARRVYGFAVGGHWSVADEHTPYVSLRYQTSDQQPISGLTDYDRYTRISAGWNWQVKSNWQVRAEANFTYDEPRWNLLSIDRTRFQFSTRYDLK
ncbi:MAG: hypothetical protein AMS22_12480 [Thiotrichales bacterium SG8_50]|nr:MAG: hypothetical protein AMS22_12480 [Thiotrichales bacterium SG8_50]